MRVLENRGAAKGKRLQFARFMSFSVPYTELAKETGPLEGALVAAFQRVLRSGRYIQLIAEFYGAN